METKVELVHRPKKSKVIPIPPLDLEAQTTINSARSDSTKPDQALLLSASCSNTNSGASLMNKMNDLSVFKQKKNNIFRNLEKLQNRCDSKGFPILKGSSETRNNDGRTSHHGCDDGGPGFGIQIFPSQITAESASHT